MTLTKFAKLAHVSVSTASKAFSMSGDINEKTREEIFRIARENGCFKQFFNAPYPHFVIGVIIPEFNSFLYADYVENIQRALKEKGCEICVSATDFSAEKERELIEYFYKYSTVDGLILVSPREDPGAIELPTVLISKQEPEDACVINSSGDEEQIKTAMEYLAAKGVSSVGFVGEKRSDDRHRNFRATAQEVFGNVQEDLIEMGGLRFEKGGYAGMEALFEKGKVPRAVFCAYDYMAIGAMKCIRDHGLRVPQDVAVVGFDNISQDPFLDPPLASISQDRRTICRHAAEQVINRILGKPFEKLILVPSEFHHRESFEI